MNIIPVVMFLPSAGLYAEVILRATVVQLLQRECHIVVSDSSTFAVFLNSLQMGFRSFAIQKRSVEALPDVPLLEEEAVAQLE